MRRRAIFAAVLFAGSSLLGPALGAQQTGNGPMAGKVTDAPSGGPLESVTIAVQGTQLGAILGPDGTYRTERVPNGWHVVTARRIGFGAGTRTVTTTDGQTTTVDFALQTSAVNLQEVVVTGTAGNQTRAAQGAVVSTINAAEVTTVAPVSNVTQVLEGRVAGVNVTAGAGTTGTASRINIRGAALCQGKTAGTPISDNPLQREGVFRNGNLGLLDYSGQGGGESFGYFVSADASNEYGTAPSNYYLRRTGRAHINWVTTPALGIDASIGVSRNDYRLPQGDDANYGYLTQQYALSDIFGVTVGPNGTRSGGLSTPVAGLEAIQNELTTVRFTPTAQIRYTPLAWFTNRLTIGGDISSTHGVTFFPKNSQSWYNGDQANGYVEDVQDPVHIYT